VEVIKDSVHRIEVKQMQDTTAIMGKLENIESAL